MSRGRLAFAKDLRRFRLQAFDKRRVTAFGNPEIDFRDFRQRGQFLQMRDGGLKQETMVSCVLVLDFVAFGLPSS